MNGDELSDYEGLVYNTANDVAYDRRVLSQSDLRQIGRMAAWEALANYEPTSKATKHGWVAHMVRQKVHEAAQEFYGPFRLPKNVLSQATVVKDNKEDPSKALAEKFPWRRFNKDYILALRHVRIKRDMFAFDKFVASEGPETEEDISLAAMELGILLEDERLAAMIGTPKGRRKLRERMAK